MTLKTMNKEAVRMTRAKMMVVRLLLTQLVMSVIRLPVLGAPGTLGVTEPPPDIVDSTTLMLIV
jgi:hypothetical protein